MFIRKRPRFPAIRFLPLLLSLDCAQAQLPPGGNRAWQRSPDNPILVPGFEVTRGGPLGLNAADPSVLYDEQERKWKMWFGAGWFGPQKFVGTKCAESLDGFTWTVQEGLAFAPSGDPNLWDYDHSETPTVVKNLSAPPERRYMLWYSGGNSRQRQINGWPYYQIGAAFSPDGRVFTRVPRNESPYGQAGLVLTSRDAFSQTLAVLDGILSDPEVVLKDGVFHMWVTSIGLNASGSVVASGISFARSSDGVHWTASQRNPLPSLIRPENAAGPARPSALWNSSRGVFEMWYDDDTEEELRQLPTLDAIVSGYWYADSTDGEEWRNSYRQGRDFVWNPSAPSETQGPIAGPGVVFKDGEYRMYYGAYGTVRVPPGWDPPIVWAINLAFRSARVPHPPGQSRPPLRTIRRPD